MPSFTPERHPVTGVYGDRNGDGITDAKDMWTREELKYIREWVLTNSPTPKEDDANISSYESWNQADYEAAVEAHNGAGNSSKNIDRPGFINRVHYNWIPPVLRERLSNYKKIYFTEKHFKSTDTYYKVYVLCPTRDKSIELGTKITNKLNLSTTSGTGDNQDEVEIMLNFDDHMLNKFRRLLKGNGIRNKLRIEEHIGA